MTHPRISIGQVKRDISKLVNRVAYGGERIVLTSRGQPKAVLVSLEDLERIQQVDRQTKQAQWQAWLNELDQLHAQIMTRRSGKLLDVDALIDANKADLDTRHDDLVSR